MTVVRRAALVAMALVAAACSSSGEGGGEDRSSTTVVAASTTAGSGNSPAATDPAVPGSSISAPSTSAPSPEPAGSFPAIAGATGSVYLAGRDGELVEVDLGAGRIATTPLPAGVGVTPDRVAVLAEGVVLYREDDSGSAAFPFDPASAPKAGPKGVRYLSHGGDRVVATLPSTQLPRGVDAPLTLIDGRGEVTATLTIDRELFDGIDRSGATFRVVGDRLVESSGEWVSISTGATGAIVPMGFVLRADATGVVVNRCDAACEVTSETYDGVVSRRSALPAGVDPSLLAGALIDRSGTRFVYLERALTGPEKVQVLDLASGEVRTIFTGEDLPRRAALTPDDRFAVMLTEGSRGEITLLPLDGAPPVVIVADRAVTAMGVGRSGAVR